MGNNDNEDDGKNDDGADNGENASPTSNNDNDNDNDTEIPQSAERSKRPTTDGDLRFLLRLLLPFCPREECSLVSPIAPRFPFFFLCGFPGMEEENGAASS